MKNLFKLSGILAFAALTVFFSACKKDKPTTVVITVVDTDGARVKDAEVRLFGKSSNPEEANPDAQIRFKETKYSDGSGQVTFDLSDQTKPGQAGFVVLDIEVHKIDQTGLGTVRVEEEKTNEKTVTIQ
ncbi:MAG: hypothetical protein V4616_06610 [Bacteroidota bacterium]